MTKSPRVRKERSKREREEGRTSEEGANPFGKSSITGMFPSRSEEGNKSKEMEMKTNENKVHTKKGISGSERGDERKRRKMAGG
ncbi:hypothetical protein MTP99_015744 [Tenebrio molitor]|jgi:hypothetical protein|nr:hypothetical protein MTP99_015744 [Tenebrio molitor]